MHKLIFRFRGFIIAFITGSIFSIAAPVIFINGYLANSNFLMILASILWDIINIPFEIIFERIMEHEKATNLGELIDILFYAFLFQFLWNKYKKRKVTVTKPKS